MVRRPWLLDLQPCEPGREKEMLRTNEGNIDRLIRVVVGLGLLALVFLGPETAWGWLGLIPLLTGLFGFCPLYRMLGVDTCPARR